MSKKMADMQTNMSKKAVKVLGVLTVGTHELTKKAIVEGSDGMMEAIVIGLGGALGPIEVSASFLGNPYGPGNTEGKMLIEKATTTESLTFAALVLAASAVVNSLNEDCKCGHGAPHKAQAIGLDFGNHAIMQAMEWYEKLFGEKPDKYLDHRMAASIREQMAGAEAPLSEFLSKRKGEQPQAPLQ